MDVGTRLVKLSLGGQSNSGIPVSEQIACTARLAARGLGLDSVTLIRVSKARRVGE